MDMSIKRLAENALNKQIHNYGKTAYIKYHVSNPCVYCVLDPVSGAGRFNCSTCHGTGRWNYASTYPVKGILNSFVGNMGFIKYGTEKISLAPIGQSRLSVWLQDILFNPYSHTARTYLDSAESIRIGADYYAVKDYSRIGIDDEARVCVITLERKNNGPVY